MNKLTLSSGVVSEEERQAMVDVVCEFYCRSSIGSIGSDGCLRAAEILVFGMEKLAVELPPGIELEVSFSSKEGTAAKPVLAA